MNNKGKKYTREEGEAVLRALEESTSMKECFMVMAERLGRTPKSLSAKWYSSWSNPYHKDYLGTAFVMIKKNKAGINRTNTEKFPVELPKSIWTRVKNCIKSIFNGN